tara:strand:- start:167 stop:514 length:348 start_codon:yes stop_codon:yes gene_type:complete
MQGEIQEAAYAYQSEIESNEQIIVGVNDFVTDQAIEIDRLSVDKEISELQIEKVRAFRENRDIEKVSSLLDYLSKSARGSDNLVPIFIECVENRITLGEICNVLRSIWGEYRSTT